MLVEPPPFFFGLILFFSRRPPFSKRSIRGGVFRPLLQKVMVLLFKKVPPCVFLFGRFRLSPLSSVKDGKIVGAVFSPFRAAPPRSGRTMSVSVAHFSLFPRYSRKVGTPYVSSFSPPGPFVGQAPSPRLRPGADGLPVILPCSSSLFWCCESPFFFTFGPGVGRLSSFSAVPPQQKNFFFFSIL